MTISVVIPNYNYARYVGAAVDSALEQTCAPHEVVVVDNGSTDDSLDVLAAYGDRIRVVQQENRGQAGARNSGMAECTGDLVAFLDADDVWLPDKLERQLALIESAGAGLVYCGLEAVGPDLEPLGDVVEPRFRGWVVNEFLTRPGVAVVVGGESTALVRRAVLDDVGQFDPELSISAGWDLWRRIATRYEVDFVDAPLVRYRQHGAGAHRRLGDHYRDMRYAYRKLFDDPVVDITWRRRHRVTGQLEWSFAKAFAAAGRPGAAVGSALRALGSWPLTPLDPIRR